MGEVCVGSGRQARVDLARRRVVAAGVDQLVPGTAAVRLAGIAQGRRSPETGGIRVHRSALDSSDRIRLDLLDILRVDAGQHGLADQAQVGDAWSADTGLRERIPEHEFLDCAGPRLGDRSPEE